MMLLTKEASHHYLNKDYFVRMRVFEWAQKKREKKRKVFNEGVIPNLNIHY